METSGPTSGVPKTVATGTPATNPARWQVGQLLQATVAQSDIGKVLLSIGNRQVSAQTSLPLQTGQQLTLQVRALGEQPLLRIMTNLSAASPVTDAVRMLLPRQAALTPLLASLAQLSRSANPPLPAKISELVRNMLKQLPDAPGTATAAGLKNALRSSGIFLESSLAQAAQGGNPAAPVEADFKANLLRLVQALRDWPAKQQPGAAQVKPPPPATTGSTAQTATATAPSSASAGQPAGLAQTPAGGQNRPAGTATPEQLGRAISHTAVAATSTAKPAAPAAAGTTTTPSPGAAAGSNATGSSPAPAAGSAPPPFRGSVPLPQAVTEPALDLLNRLGNLRPDLLQQAEAALARIQLHQLATLPREGERGLLEWLFELPIRHGDELDLWALRLYREAHSRTHQAERKPADWSMQLAFELPGLGPVQALVQLSGDKVSTRFWAENTDTVPLFNQHLDELRRALLAAGLEVAELDCLPGSIQTGGTVPAGNFIREKA